MNHYEDSLNCNQCGGNIDARGTFSGPAAIPTPAQMQAWFPDPWNADTWNFAAISPWMRTYTIGIGEFPNQYHQPKYGAWAQDDWRISDKLTLNLGLRYDLSLNSFGERRRTRVQGRAAALLSRRADRTTPTTSSRALGSRIS